MPLMTKQEIAQAAHGLSHHDFIAKLEADGFKQLGAGCYGAAYGRGKKFVVKVGHRGKAHRDGYAAYAGWLYQGQRKREADAMLPEFPRVMHFSMHGNEDERSDYYVAIIERLDELTEDARSKTPALRRRTRDGERMEEASKKILDAMGETAKRACDVIRERFSHAWGLDMHDGNFLMRGPQVVITDPLSCPR